MQLYGCSTDFETCKAVKYTSALLLNDQCKTLLHCGAKRTSNGEQQVEIDDEGSEKHRKNDDAPHPQSGLRSSRSQHSLKPRHRLARRRDIFAFFVTQRHLKSCCRGRWGRSRRQRLIGRRSRCWGGQGHMSLS